MGSLESGISFKKDDSFESFRSLSNGRIERLQSKGRSRFSRFLLSQKLGYLQWISIVVVFSLFLGFFQFFLPASVSDRPGNPWKNGELASLDAVYFKDLLHDLDFGQDLRFEPKWVSPRFQKEARELNSSKIMLRFSHRKPLIALVFADLAFDSYQVLMTTVAAALQEIGYSIEVISTEDGPAITVWHNMGIPVTLIPTNNHQSIDIDWLNYDGILVNSLEAKGTVSCLMQEPFRSLPLIWTVHEKTLAARFSHYTSSGKAEVLSDWKKSFSRATVVVFPNYALPVIYSPVDSGNYYVIPGAPAEACEIGRSLNMNKEHLNSDLDVKPDDFVIAIVGSHFLYKGQWLEHSLVLQALKPLLAEFPSQNDSHSRLKIFVLTSDSTNNYTRVVEAISAGLKYPEDVVKHVAGDANTNDVLGRASLVIYGSFLEEQSFPDILATALCFGKLIIAPRLSMIEKFVNDRVSGYLYPKEDIQVLAEIVSQVVSGGELTSLARNVASIGKENAKGLMVSDAVEGYALLLESVLRLPSEVAPPKAVSEIPQKRKKEWQWNIFGTIPGATYKNRTLSSSVYLDTIEQQNRSRERSTEVEGEAFIYKIWEEERESEADRARKRRANEELKDRSEQTRGTWEDVYRNAKRADRVKNDLHERDDGELERTGQPLCIYEPYFGQGTWPFLHRTSLYRGIGLSSRGRRPGTDDIDASSRLPLLSSTYYRDALGELGAFFAIAYRIDRIHKNAWIGFQSWRLTARKGSLSKAAELVLLNATQTRKNGDTLYFWARMDSDPRNSRSLDFWSFCDSINAGNCRSAFSSTLKHMYGISGDLDSLPPMPQDGDTWSVMHSWAMPTRSFVEFVMFARMFVDSLDAQMYDEHHESGLCYLSLAKVELQKVGISQGLSSASLEPGVSLATTSLSFETRDKHCHSRVLELLVNVWAYHSARRMVYIDPKTGATQEQHHVQTRRGKMWVQWFSLATLKGMDEDLAEEADSDPPKRRWLWPSTGEVFWRGMVAKERSMRQREKEKRKQQSRDKLHRMRRRTRQKVLGKYVKPPPEEEGRGGNATVVLGR